MPTITLATYVSGDVPSQLTLTQRLYWPKATLDSFAVLNGKLDADNLTEALKAESFRRGSFAEAASIGGTTNLDYFSDVLRNYADDPDEDDEAAKLYIPIPGANVEFHVAKERATNTYFSWNVCIANDGATSSEQSYLRLFIDGAAVPGQRRTAPFAQGTKRQGAIRDRRWCGMHVASLLSRGYHTAGLYIAGGAPQTRIRVRAFRAFTIY